jgi:hypothetical protein
MFGVEVVTPSTLGVKASGLSSNLWTVLGDPGSHIPKL